MLPVQFAGIADEQREPSQRERAPVIEGWEIETKKSSGPHKIAIRLQEMENIHDEESLSNLLRTSGAEWAFRTHRTSEADAKPLGRLAEWGRIALAVRVRGGFDRALHDADTYTVRSRSFKQTAGRGWHIPNLVDVVLIALVAFSSIQFASARRIESPGAHCATWRPRNPRQHRSSDQ